jgi:cysteinyl-tRNA synthetase
VFDLVRSGNSAVDAGDVATAASQAAQVVAMLDVLGVNPLDDQWSGSSSQGDAALELLMTELLDARAAARANKDFATADLLRERLAAAGITIEDTPSGAHWSFNGR